MLNFQPRPPRPADKGGLAMAQTATVSSAVAHADTAPTVRKITLSDLADALRKGVDDFLAMPSHVVFLCVLYPLAGLFFARIAFGYDLVPMLYPLAAGFALVGPLAAIGIYELSRRRERGLQASWKEAFGVLRSRSMPAIAALGAVLLAIFGAWLLAAQTIYETNFGTVPPVSLAQFATDILTTRAGWTLILLGNAVGFLFAVVVFMISAVSFPLLLDRRVSFSTAVGTSLEAIWENPLVMTVWAMIIAGLLLLGSLPLLMGLAIVLPVLGHSTWHLYRKVVDADGNPRPGQWPRRKARKSAADFPSALVPWTR
jgi:uncharacterized membrane protein